MVGAQSLRETREMGQCQPLGGVSNLGVHIKSPGPSWEPSCWRNQAPWLWLRAPWWKSAGGWVGHTRADDRMGFAFPRQEEM